MSLISNALKKAQETRQNITKNKAGDIVYLTDAPQSWPRTALMGLLILSALMAVLISVAAMVLTMKNADSKQMQLTGLEKTIKNQEKRINDLVATIHKNQKFTDGQIRGLNIQVNGHYSNLKDAILDDKEEISILDKYAKELNRKLEKISAIEDQLKVTANPANGTQQ